MKILILGSHGQTGGALALLSKKAGAEILAIDRDEIDIADQAQVDRIVAEYAPTHILNTAAYNAVDAAEDDADAAFAVNALAPAYLALAAKRSNAVLVHYSSDYIFDGEKDSGYVEGDPPNPLSVYGRSKLLGEQAVIAIHAQSYVLRTSWVFGPGGNNFVSRLLALAEVHSDLSFIDDQWSAPTYAPDLAQATLALIGRSAPHGIYHAAGREALSPFAWAKQILTRAGSATRLNPVRASQFKTRAARPRRAVLANARLAALGIAIPPASARLEDYFSGRIEVAL